MHSTVTLFDVDNTLLDNDRVAGDLRRFLSHSVSNRGSALPTGLTTRWLYVEAMALLIYRPTLAYVTAAAI
jgi:FMN phosphatase YigB (HAD superfamily)